MRKTQFPVVLVLILVFSYAIFHIAGLVIVLIASAVTYMVTGRVHPRVRHTGFRGCGGTGEHRGAIFTWRFRKCPRCNSGRLISWGAGHFGASHIQSEYDRSKRARAAAREQNRWR